MFDMAQPAMITVRTAADPKVAEFRSVVSNFPSTVPADQLEEHREAVEAWRGAEDASIRVMDAFDFKNADQQPEAIESGIRECILLNEAEKTGLLAAIRNTIDDLKHFKLTGKIRRPEIWFAET